MISLRAARAILPGTRRGPLEAKLGDSRNVINPHNEVSRHELPHTQIFVVLCLATAQARHYLENLLREMWEPLGTEYGVIVVHPLRDEHCLKPGDSSTFETLTAMTIMIQPLKMNIREKAEQISSMGSHRGLPLVLSHNTPNNSLYLLWAESKKVRRCSHG